MNIYFSFILGVSFLIVKTRGAPQGEASSEEKPMPYEYNYHVEDATEKVYFGAKESGNDVGRVEGSYYVWLPDGKLMKVSYYVDGDSGFVPTITFEDNPNPIGSGAPPN